MSAKRKERKKEKRRRRIKQTPSSVAFRLSLEEKSLIPGRAVVAVVVAVVASISQEITSATLIYTHPPPTAAAA
jgi:cell division protein FtsL